MEQSIETFYKSVAQSPAALTQLTAGVQTPDEFIDRAVSVGNEQGYKFTREEATLWINNQIEARKNGELSDVQLEGVAGGKGSVSGVINTVSGGISTGYNAVNSGINTVGGAIGGATGTAVNTVSGGISSGASAVGSWFSSW
jgi:hypothetical protein